MKRRLRSVVLLTSLAVCLSGCGGRGLQKDTTGEKSKADTVIQNAGMNNEEKRKEFLEENQDVVLTNRCLYIGDSDDDVIVQMDHEGNELNRFRVNEDENAEVLVCGSDKRLILGNYAEDEDAYDETLTLYSVPVLQTDDSENVRWEQKEEVGLCKDEVASGAEVVLCEPYLFYKEDYNTLVRLNMETGERKNFTFPLTELYLFACVDGYLYLLNENDDDVDMDSGGSSAVYRFNVAEGITEKLYEREKQGELIDHLFVDGQSLFMLFDVEDVMDRVECFDLEQKKTVGQLPVGEIKRLIKEEVMSGSVEECWEFALDGLSVYKGRLYIMVRTSWLTEKGGDGDAGISRTVLLSCADKDMTDLKYEQDLAEWFQKQDCDETVSGLGMDGEEDSYYFLYESYEREKPNITHLMRYHLDTKQIEEADEKELLHKVLLY